MVSLAHEGNLSIDVQRYVLAPRASLDIAAEDHCAGGTPSPAPPNQSRRQRLSSSPPSWLLTHNRESVSIEWEN